MSSFKNQRILLVRRGLEYFFLFWLIDYHRQHKNIILPCGDFGEFYVFSPWAKLWFNHSKVFKANLFDIY